MLNFELLHPRMTDQDLGFLPTFLEADNSAPAREQLHNNYSHGGGWRPFNGFQLHEDNSIEYPGDPPLKPLAKAKLREETILFYRHAWVAIIQPDRSFEICRMD